MNSGAARREGAAGAPLAGTGGVRGGRDGEMAAVGAAGDGGLGCDGGDAIFLLACQHSCASSTCIAKRVLSRLAWNSLLPRFVSRSSPKSNFIRL
jgi:hypothetical protein